MAQHYGLIPKDIAENIAKANNKPYTTFVSKGIRRYIWSYTSSGTFKTPNYSPTCNVLVVAGGGSGGHDHAAAAGAGGLLYGIVTLSGQCSITIGAGATHSTGTTGVDGANSTITGALTATAIGGGRGGVL